jgi:cell division protease FtsH
MSEELGAQTFGQNQELMFLGREVQRSQDYSESTAKRIDSEVSRLIDNAFSRACDILTAQREKLNMIAELLIERETLDGRDVEEMMEHNRVLSEEERAEVDRRKEAEEAASRPAALPETGPDTAAEAESAAPSVEAAVKAAAEDGPVASEADDSDKSD